MNKLLTVSQYASLLAVPVMLAICAAFQLENTALLTFVTVALAVVPFFLKFEKAKPKPRDVMPIVILAALACAGRILFAPFPNFKPVSAIVIISGSRFGRESGFLTGALAALASNMFFGQGAWTPWQMYAWGAIGFFAGVLAQKRMLENKLGLYTFGFLSAFLFGFLLDSWHVISFVQPLSFATAWPVFLAGVPFTLSQAAATDVFLFLTYKPWTKKIKRIQTKYGI